MPAELRRFVIEQLDVPEADVYVKDGLLGLCRYRASCIVGRSARPAVQALQHPLSRAHPRVQRRLLRRHPRQGHRRPSPLRIVRRRAAVPAAGGARPGRDGDQVDALSHLDRQPDRASAEGGGRARQVGHRRRRAEGALRRGGQHPLGARSRERRRACRLRLRRAEDARQARPGRAPGRATTSPPTATSAPATIIRRRRASIPTCRSSRPTPAIGARRHAASSISSPAMRSRPSSRCWRPARAASARACSPTSPRRSRTPRPGGRPPSG